MKTYNQKFSIEFIRNVTNFVGELVYNYNVKEANTAVSLYNPQSVELIEKNNEIFYIEMDGSFINTRTKDSNNSTWVEIKLGIMFTSDDLEEYRDKDDEICYRVKDRDYISFLGSVDEFKKHLLALAIRKRFYLYKYLVIISDGAPWIKSIKDEYFPWAQHILDIYHLFENTSNFINAIFNDKNKIDKYRDKWFDLLEQGQWKEVLKDLEKYKDAELPLGVVNLYRYIENNKNCIDYPVYRMKYKFIGSGAIESGNRYVVQRRLKSAGKMWGKINAQFLLALLCMLYSGNWYLVEKITKDYLKDSN